MGTGFPTLRLVLALVGGVVVPGGPTPAPMYVAAAPSRALVHVDAPSALASAYRLPVVELPEPPTELLGEVAERAEPKCPFEVRAIVVAESARDSFAMLAVDGESKLVRRGDGLSASGRHMSVAGIDASAVAVRVGEALVRCDLSP